MRLNYDDDDDDDDDDYVVFLMIMMMMPLFIMVRVGITMEIMMAMMIYL